MIQMAKSYKEFIKIADTVTNKDTAINNFIENALNKLQSMFTYEGLPDTMPQKWLEYYLMCNGNAFVTKVNDKLYAFTGGVGGEPDEYYQPTIYTVANPALKLSKEYKINTDGVLVRNDTLMTGMLPLLKKYGSLLVEADLTIRCALINLRIFNTISATDDNTKKSADEYLTQIENGKIGVIGGNPFFDGVQIHNNANSTGYLSQLIEITQYIKASFFNELGLNANYNLKREYISTSENTLADDILLPFCDDMLAERKEGIDKINSMFGTNITVEFNSSWAANNSQNEKEIADNEKAIDGAQNDNIGSDTVSNNSDIDNNGADLDNDGGIENETK